MNTTTDDRSYLGDVCQYDLRNKREWRRTLRHKYVVLKANRTYACIMKEHRREVLKEKTRAHLLLTRQRPMHRYERPIS